MFLVVLHDPPLQLSALTGNKLEPGEEEEGGRSTYCQNARHSTVALGWDEIDFLAIRNRVICPVASFNFDPLSPSRQNG